MKTLKKWRVLVLAAGLVGAAVLLGACGGKITYQVTVRDALGNPYPSGIVVQFNQNGKKVALQSCDTSGVAAKKLAKGDYEVAVVSTDDAVAYYYEENQKLTAAQNELELVLSYRIVTEPETLSVGEGETEGYALQAGSTYVDLKADGRNYFLFTPTKAGTYEVSVPDDAAVEIGYYGNPHFIQSESRVEVVDNTFTISVEDGMIGSGDGGTSVFVIGVDAEEGTASCILGIERLGDAEYTVAEEQWTIYEASSAPEAYTLPEGAEPEDFDITASSGAYAMVYNEEDGFYHLGSEDGSLVLVYLTENPEYVDCFKTIIEYTGVKNYFYDEDGAFVKKEDYTQCLQEYIACADEASGLYPLTEDLKYIIQQAGDHNGWWDKDGHGYLFVDSSGVPLPGINSEISWLFMCCYIE